MKETLPVFISSFLCLSLCSAGETRYVNCAGQGDGGPLFGCVYLSVDLSRNEIMVGHNGEVVSEACSSDAYFCTGSRLLPLAVPKVDYEHKSAWVYGGRRYEKRSLRTPSSFPWTNVDVIAVYEAADHLLMSFWYTRKTGVVAIGFPQDGQNSGEVFYLADDVGLFHD